MKVLWFSNTACMGSEYLSKGKIKGTGGWMYALNEAIQNEVDLSVVFHYPYKIENFKYRDTMFYPVYTGNIVWENLRNRFWGKVYDSDFLTQYLNIINTVRPDIIHIHGTENSFLCIVDRVKIPVVVSIQGNLTVYNHKYLVGFGDKYLADKVGDVTLKSLLFGRKSFFRNKAKMKKMSEIESRRMQQVKYVIGRTDWDRRITRVLAPQSEYYVGNEALRDIFYTEKWNNSINKKIVLFTTNGDSYYKGFETLCHSLSLLSRLGIEVEWRVAGISRASLINKITRKHLHKNYPSVGLKLLGPLHADELVTNLKESHIYVMVSHIENSPNNLCEAMILGMPCIATFAGGTSSLMIDKKEGLLIQDGDPWVMTGAILEMLANWDMAIEMGQNARRKAMVRHNKSQIVSELIETYKKII